VTILTLGFLSAAMGEAKSAGWELRASIGHSRMATPGDMKHALADESSELQELAGTGYVTSASSDPRGSVIAEIGVARSSSSGLGFGVGLQHFQLAYANELEATHHDPVYQFDRTARLIERLSVPVLAVPVWVGYEWTRHLHIDVGGLLALPMRSSATEEVVLEDVVVVNGRRDPSRELPAERLGGTATGQMRGIVPGAFLRLRVPLWKGFACEGSARWLANPLRQEGRNAGGLGAALGLSHRVKL
jgi:hypothetical protein